jgi:hypothetical protein
MEFRVTASVLDSDPVIYVGLRSGIRGFGSGTRPKNIK